jgi:hypothetical protein
MSSVLFRAGKRFLASGALCGLLLLSSGCGGAAAPTPVTGHVTLNGKPMTSGTVTFVPNKAKGNTSGEEPLGEINAKSEYTLQTRGKPGAAPGWYKVTVTSTGPITPDNTSVTTTSIINTTYTNPMTTPLEKEVVEKPAPGTYDLQVGP